MAQPRRAALNQIVRELTSQGRKLLISFESKLKAD